MDFQEVEKTNDLREMFFENAITPYVILDEKLDFIDVNQSAIQAMNINREDFLGQNIVDVFPNLNTNNRIKAYEHVIANGESIMFNDIPYKTYNQTIKFNIKAFKIGEGIGISAQENTGLLKTNQTLENSRRNLQDINNRLLRKNNELEELIYVLSHDLRAPLVNIQSLLNILEYDNAILEEGMEVFEKIKEVATHMDSKLKAINKVNAIKTEQADKKTEVDFSELLKRIEANHSQEIINSRAIIKADFSKCPAIFFDPIKLESILHNLISNAIKYKNPKRKPIIHIKTKMVKGKTVLTVKDNGLGFDDAINYNKIFGLFKRMHTHVDGLGVGLYIINSIVANHGGKIKVKSQINKGAEFKITF
tara:strand:+ start:486 stop:1577 length:1092 start_codon:yes stop_codon:yes gene_type:complete